jgi:hypothetical protein
MVMTRGLDPERVVRIADLRLKGPYSAAHPHDGGREP